MKKREYATGELNLAAGFMSIGIPLDTAKPITLVASTTGGDYKRFHFDLLSPDGKHDVYAMSAAWNDPETFRKEQPGHPFAKIMSFISSKPQGVRSESDWLDHAASFLGLTREAVAKAYRDIPKVCQASPESEVSYVLAFIRNREWLIDAVKRMDREGNFDVMQAIGKSIVTLSAKASKKTEGFLLSHVRY